MQQSPSTTRIGPTTRLILFIVTAAVCTHAWATGWPPWTRSDSATVARGGEVDRLDSGADSVLDNDFDFERDEMQAVLTRDVRFGELELEDDGTFEYEHDGGDARQDFFLYRAWDGTGFSRETLVVISIVEPPNTPPFVVSDVPDQEAIAGAEYRLELAGHFGDLDPDDVLRFSARGLPPSNSLRIDPDTGILSGTPISADASLAPYSVEIVATDRAGASASLRFDLTIFQDNRSDLDLDISLAANPVTVGEDVQWSIEIRNKGPARLEEGQLTANWATSGPALTLGAPGSCSLSRNGTSTPSMSCGLGGLAANGTMTIDVQGSQGGDGDNTLIGIVSADDPILDNNADLASAQVVTRFSEGPTQTVDVSGADVASGDLDGDGAIDVVATDGETFVYFNSGDRTVSTPGMSLGSGSGGVAVATFDWNGDAVLDIVVAGLASRSAEVFVNDGAGGFSSAYRLNDAGVGNVRDAAVADFNLDGQDDFVLTGTSGTTVVRKSGNGSDQSGVDTGAGISLAVADFNQDTYPDLVVVRASDRAVDVHINSGDGSSFSRTRLRHGTVASVSAVDLNDDGVPDLLLAIDGSELTVPENKVLYGQSDGSFSTGEVFGASTVSKLLSGDVDLDGWTDVVALNETGVHQVYLGQQGNGLSLAAEQIVSEGMRRGVLVDFNGDESLDLIIVGSEASVLEIHANNGIGRLGLGDRVAPTITLNGEASVRLASGVLYSEQGATAVDDIDGDITDKIVIEGTINTTVVGTQRVTYKVADRAGNWSSVVRTVNVGVNQGTGGGGGGAIAPIVILILLTFSVLRRNGTRRHRA